MAAVITPITLLETAVSLYPTSPAFRIPRTSPGSVKVQEWQTITFTEFKRDVELFAKYWSQTLKDIPKKSIVGIWIGGMTYIDVLHIYGVYRAGHIPQLFSLRLPSPEVIFELLKRADAKALVYDSSFATLLKDSPVPAYLATDSVDVTIFSSVPLSDSLPPNASDTVFVFHTSGSTSGSPKLVPWTYSWMQTHIDKFIYAGMSFRQPRATSWIGSMCHAGQSGMLLINLRYGSCMIQPTSISFSSDELVDMIESCGLNVLIQFPTFLSIHFKNAHKDPKLLSLLRGLREVVYGGLSLSEEEEDWASQNGIKLVNLFGSTEVGFFMFTEGSSGETSRLFRAVTHVYPRCRHELRPIASEEESESGAKSSARLLELVVLSDSADCPHPSLRSVDGDFHTGDLFEEVRPGYYISRGRNDDWIKSANSLRCDTKAIEDNVRASCGHLIEDCIAVGYGRPSPALFIEPAVNMDAKALKAEIIRLIRPFHSRRYVHERIVSEQLVIIVPSKSLPRTASKGNIRRKAVEEVYKDQLDAIYNSM